MYIVLSTNFLLVELVLSLLIGFVFYKYLDDHFITLILTLGIGFTIAYVIAGILTQTMHGNMLFIAGFVFFLPWFAMGIGSELRDRLSKIRSKKDRIQTQDMSRRKKVSAEEYEEIYTKKREEIFRGELEEYMQLQKAMGKLTSAPEKLTPDEKSMLQQTVREIEPLFGMTIVAAIGGLESWEGEAPLDVTQEELDQIPDVVTVSYVCPNCREINKFEYRKLSTPLSKAPESMNIVGGRLFTTTTADCLKCNRTTKMALLQCDECGIGWQPFFFSAHAERKLLLTGTCHVCFFERTKS
ncbi:MAG: hypothetical protein ACXACG_18400 [Candidatus Thorarchaeota archaeon]|jgi:hypothetical protein